MRKTLKKQAIVQMLEIFPDTTNREYAQTEIARDNDLSVDKIIKKPEPMPSQMPGQPTGQGQLEAQMAPKPQQQPSINSLING